VWIPVLIALGCLAWSLQVRRVAWYCIGEKAITLAVALMATAVLLLTPPVSVMVGVPLHAVTGLWNLQAFAAHVCCIAAGGAVVYHVTWRIHDDDELARSFHLWVQLPARLAITGLFALLVMGNGVRVRVRCFYQLPLDAWMRAYWLLLCLILGWIVVYAGRAMWYLRREEASRPAANMYLVAAGCGIAALAIRGAQAVFADQQDMMLASVFGCDAMMMFALGAARSWQRKIAWLTVRTTPGDGVLHPPLQLHTEAPPRVRKFAPGPAPRLDLPGL
jgi:hypothetical protein